MEQVEGMGHYQRRGCHHSPAEAGWGIILSPLPHHAERGLRADSA